MRVGWVLAATILAIPAAGAQTVLAGSSTAPPPGSALPPPGINEPGAKPQAVPLPNTGIPPSVAPAAREQGVKGRNADPNAEVTVHTDAAGDTIQEYRRGGEVYMVRITPKHGLTQTYHYDSPNGSLVHNPNLGPVSPVYYDIYKWGKPRPPASGESVAQPAQASSSG
ncbi:MAG: DUF2782 domain-containing protein [Rhodanobacteraceae bacterium]